MNYGHSFLALVADYADGFCATLEEKHLVRALFECSIIETFYLRHPAMYLSLNFFIMPSLIVVFCVASSVPSHN